MYLLIRLTNFNLGLPIINQAEMILLLVDQQISYRKLIGCTNNSTNTNTKIITFGHNLPNDIPGVHTYVVTDLNSATQTVTNYYK